MIKLCLLPLYLTFTSCQYQNAGDSVVHSLPSLTPAPSLHPSPHSFSPPHRRYRYSPMPSGERHALIGNEKDSPIYYSLTQDLPTSDQSPASGSSFQAGAYHSLLPSGETLPAYHSLLPSGETLPAYNSQVADYKPPQRDYQEPEYLYYTDRVPECAETNALYYNLTFCLQDHQYPVETLKYHLEHNVALVRRLLSDVSYQSADNLVDGLTKYEEEGYSYKHYYGSDKLLLYKADYEDYSYNHDYNKGGGYICPADVFYGRPKRAVNTYGKWKVIINLPGHTQTQRLEQCMYPQAPCSFIDHAYHSACLQKHSFVRLLAYSYQQGLHIDSFKLPTACSCHVSAPKTAEYGSEDPSFHQSSTPFPYQPSISLYSPSSTPQPSHSPNPYTVYVG